MKFATAALVAIAAQATQVFAAAAIDPIAEECGALGVMKYTPKAGENVDISNIRKCKEHPLSVNGVSAGPEQVSGALEKRECWYGEDYGCSKGYCFQKCGSSGEWCWTAWNGGLGEWRSCDSNAQCDPSAAGSACGQGDCDACGCSC
ncbi:hypothetical protein KVR01_010695 [Diaporthe batatas]|uniref:uncharacterized protein n=1 Tax=Diaporthe batatas TaxID=748121 RepID=UPI001D050A7C|nr:uncharacterized protein KVR01_010695 [Diaporthe batatas]KAG8160058.1 hypothetical protein KVR01_010695 [Diaporthe batatas]